jgi:valyl-tRNA synthetase
MIYMIFKSQIGYRQFCNKLWNAVRFAMLHFQPEKGYTYTPLLDGYDQLAASAQLAPRDRWILSRLTAMLQAVDAGMASYSFAAVTAALYDFWLYEFCDYYLELVKPLLNPGGAATPEAGEAGATAAAASAGGDVPAAAALARLVLYVCLDAGLRALHPMMPFVTEELWQRMPGRGAAWRADGSVTSPPSIMIAPYPRTGTGAGNLPSFASAGVEADFEAFKDALKAGRNLRSEAELLPAKEAAFVIVATTPEARRPLEAHARDLITLLKASSLAIVGSIGDVTSERTSAAVVSDVVSIYMKVGALN